MNHSKTVLQLKINQGECNGFQLTNWFINDQLILSTSETQKLPESLDLHLTLPCVITIEMQGKNMQTDTKIVDGKIIQDKYIHLTQARLAKYPIKESVLYAICHYAADDGQIYNNTFWHRNGKVQIELNTTDPISWHLTHNV